MNYTRLDIWSIGQTLQKIQTGLFNIWTIWTGWYLLNFCQVRQCEFSPAMCMKCEAFYRKPHIVSKTHNVSSNGSTRLYRNKIKITQKLRHKVFQPLESLNIQGKKVRIFKNVSKGSPLTYFFLLLKKVQVSEKVISNYGSQAPGAPPGQS